MDENLLTSHPVPKLTYGGGEQTDQEYDQEPIRLHSKKMREYVQFIFWMVKDFAWCLYWATPSIIVCVLTICVQATVVYFDSHSRPHLILNVSELCWLSGNTCWMFGDMLWDSVDTEFKISDTPLIKMSDTEYHRIVHVALCFFAVGLFPSVSYIVHRIVNSATKAFDMDDYHILIIVFWIFKDVSWCFFNLHENLSSKIFGIFFGTSAFLTAVHMIMRSKQFVYTYWINLLHCFWILGNLLWMTSEYQSNDPTKVVAIVSFSVGLMVAAYMGYTIVYPDLRNQHRNYQHDI